MFLREPAGERGLDIAAAMDLARDPQEEPRMSRSAARKTTRTKTITYDVAEQLRTPEEMAAYLDAWLTEAPEDSAGISR